MYKVIIAVKNPELLHGLTALHVWGEMTEFEIAAVSDSVGEVFDMLKARRFDLLMAEDDLWKEQDFRQLKLLKAEGLCSHIALCGVNEDFQAARQAMIIGAYDYFVLPFDSAEFISLFRRIKNETHESKAAEIYYIEEITEYFENHDNSISGYLDELAGKILSKNGNAAALYGRILDGAAEEIFDRFDWLDLYLSVDDFHSDNFTENDVTEEYVQRHNRRLLELFEKFVALYPPHNAKIHDVIHYILNNPESDLRQKTLSEKLFINSTYLSTMFTAQTDIRFVDYVTEIKLTRAVWLLDNTNMKITEIAGRLDYKDIGYFSRQFKKKYGLTPTEYRIPENYSFDI